MTEYEFNESAQPVFEEEEEVKDKTLLLGIAALVVVSIVVVTSWVMRRRRANREARAALEMLTEPKIFEAAEKRARAARAALGDNAGWRRLRNLF